MLRQPELGTSSPPSYWLSGSEVLKQDGHIYERSRCACLLSCLSLLAWPELQLAANHRKAPSMSKCGTFLWMWQSGTNVHIRVFQRRLRGREEPPSCKIGISDLRGISVETSVFRAQMEGSINSTWGIYPPPRSTQPLAEKLWDWTL